MKKLAQTMLMKIKARIHELDHWRDKEETQSIISVLIRDLLWADCLIVMMIRLLQITVNKFLSIFIILIWQRNGGVLWIGTCFICILNI
ncbi:MAG: hypothetical protein IKJ59_08600 [Clostridia bacterium]|nr:hypothetical protein [Clostridia bacterium]